MMAVTSLVDAIQKERTQALHYIATGRQEPELYQSAVQTTINTATELTSWPVSQEESGKFVLSV